MSPYPCKLNFLFSYLTELIPPQLPILRSAVYNMIHVSILSLLLAVSSIQATETDLPVPVASPQSAAGSSLFEPLLTEKSEFLKDTELLPPDSAFLFSAQLIDSQHIELDWQIAPGYYLYRDKFQFSLLNGGQLGDEFHFPAAQLKEDLKLGQISVYENHLTLQLPINNTAQLSQLTLQTIYQGCAEARLCYPPIEKITQFPLLSSSQNSKPPVTDQAPPSEITDPEETSLVAAQTRTDSAGKPLVLNPLDKLLPSDQNAQEFLPVEKAFQLSAQSPTSEHIVLTWQIAEGYYLYRDKFKFTLNTPGTLGTVEFPKAYLYKDPTFGKVEIYTQSSLSLTLPIKDAPLASQLQVEYQGCAVAGLCYPPITQLFDLQLGKGPALLSESDQITQLLMGAQLWTILAAFFGFGLLLSLTPCIYPMIPILNSCILGQKGQLTTLTAFRMSLIYVLAMSLTYASLGAVTGLVGDSLQNTLQQPWVLILFSLLLIGLALSMFGYYDLQLPNFIQTKLAKLSHQQQGGTTLGLIIMGILSALIVGPCVAPPLAGALLYIGQTKDAWLGGSALFMMGLGMGIPLILTGTFAGHYLPKAGRWMETTKAVLGVALLGMAIMMLTSVFPPAVILLLWALLLMISAIYLGAFENLTPGLPGGRKFLKGLGLVLWVYGCLLLIGAASGANNVLQPLANLIPNTATQATISSPLNFQPVKNLTELQQALTKAQGNLVMLEFSADWCVSCKELEQFTFTDARVQQKLAALVLLKADVTLHDEQAKALYQHFGIYGPPALLFFSTTGAELRAYRVIGFLSADDFYAHLQKVLS